MSYFLRYWKSFFNAKLSLKLLCELYSWCLTEHNTHIILYVMVKTKLCCSRLWIYIKAGLYHTENFEDHTLANQLFTQNFTAQLKAQLNFCSERQKLSNTDFIYESGTWDLNDLHSVQQGRWNSRCGVGSSYKKNLGKVKGHI